MRGTRRIRGLVGIVFGLGLVAHAGGDADRTRPGFHRDASARPAAPAPSPTALPDVLVLEDVGQAATLAARRGPRQILEARARAERAATRAAEEARRRFYLAGYRDGLRTAMADERLGRWDRLQGLRLGRLDRDARRDGRVAGRDAASEMAALVARDRVEAQFRDLSRDPTFAPGNPDAAYDPPAAWAGDVGIDDIWPLFPRPLDPRAAARLAEACTGTPYGPRELYAVATLEALVDRSWTEPRYETFAARTRPPAVSHGAPARNELREEFDRAYRARIAAEYRRTVRPAYDAGFADGWDHGALLRYEWSFRLGYARGYDEAATASARRAYLDHFPRAYRSAYTGEFDAWWTTPRPEIVAVDWTDADGDGVLQPGESLRVDYEVANYGGADAVVAVALDADRLRTDLPVTVTIPARSIARTPAELRAFASPATPARSRHALALRVGELRADLVAEVRWPLELTGDVRIDRLRVLDGAVRLEIELVNLSRRPLDAAVEIARPFADRVAASRQPGTIGPGERGRAYLELEGLQPLDLLGGRIESDLIAYAGRERQDVRAYRFPEIATDLDRSDLLDYLVALSRDAGARASDVAEARRLLMRRLRADWRRAARSKGNPYKSDLRRGTTRTALGELVAVAERRQRAVAAADVFAGLDRDVEALARDLPGVHPLLRKSMRRLARRLG